MFHVEHLPNQRTNTMPSMTTIFQVAIVTMAAMYTLNLLASKSPAVRPVIKGTGLIAV